MPGLSLALALALAADPCRASFSPALRDRALAPNFAGMPGIVEVPTATAAGEGEVWFAFNEAERLYANEGITSQSNSFVTIGLFPRLTVSARGSVTRTGTSYDIFNRDLSASAQFLLARETTRRPAVMIGLQDISGSNAIYEARVLTATKSLLGRVRLTAGYGDGFSLLDGAFGGVEIAPCHWISFLAEHDGLQRNVGVRLAPFPSFGERFGLRLTLDAVERGEQGMVFGAGLRTALVRPRPERPAPPTTAARPSQPRGTDEAVRDRLVAAGLENVRVARRNTATLLIHYENRRFQRDELDALGVVLGIAADAAPSEISALEVTLRRTDLPVLVVNTDRATLQRYLEDPASASAFADQLHVDVPTAGARDATVGPVANGSRFRLDLSAQPRVENNLLTEVSALETRLSLLPEATVQLGRGLSASARKAVVLHTSEKFEGGARDPNADRLLIHQALRLPGALLPQGVAGIGQLSFGRFGPREVGAMWDQDLLLPSGRWSLGGQVGTFGPTLYKPERSVGIASVRWRDPARGTVISVGGGRFLRGDMGGFAELTRRLGLTEFTFFVRSTDLSNEGGLRVGIPLAPRRDLKPARVRPRMPAFWEHSQRMTLFEEIPFLPVGVALPLETGHEVVRVYAGRDWMQPSVIRSRVWVLREAALRWAVE